LLRIIAGHDVGTNSIQGIEHRKGGTFEDDCFAAALADGQEQTAAFHIDAFPPQMQDFAQAAAGDEKPPKRGRRERVDPRGSIASTRLDWKGASTGRFVIRWVVMAPRC
jgi:hypothetical protein